MSNHSVLAQDYLANVQFYNYENGLAGRFANCTFKDSRGIIWIGTQFGLNRFDGRDFLLFNEPSGLPFNQVMEIYEDSEGWLWLFRSCKAKRSCTRNLAFLHTITHEIRTFEEWFGEDVDFSPAEILSIVTNDKKEVFWSADKKVYHWKEGKIAQQCDLNDWEATPKLLCALEDGKLAGWFQSIDDPETPSVEYRVFDMFGDIRFSQKPQNLKSNSGRITDLELLGRDYLGRRIVENGWYEYPKGKNFVLNHDGRLVVDTADWGDFLKSGSYGYNPFRPEIWQTITRNQNDKHGLFIYTPSKGLTYSFGEEFPELTKPLANRQIRFDEDNVTWFSGRLGVFRIQLKRNPFQRILHNPLSDIESPRKHIVMGVIPFEEGKKLLTAQAHHYFKFTNNEAIPINELKEELRTNAVTMVKGFSNKWWVAEEHSLRGILKIGNGFNIERINFKEEQKFDNVLSLFYDNNILWIGTDKGFYYFDHIKKQLFAFENHNGFEEIQNSIVNQIYEERENRIWLCTSSGLYHFSTEEGIKERYGTVETDQFKLPGIFFYQMLPAKQGGWWLASREGLVYWNPSENRTQHITTKEGLPANEIFNIHEDEFGFLWLTTDAGLVQFKISTGKIKTYLEEDGISSNDFEPFTYYAEKVNIGSESVEKVWFGTTNGYTVFYPKDFKEIDFSVKPDVPLNILRFEQFSGDTKKLENRTAELLQTQQIILQPGEQLFNLRVALADYVTGEDAQYAYRIKGVQDFWQEGKENLIRISGLPYGQFVLEIRGMLANGEYSSNEIHLPIQVLRPFYLKNWFFIATGLSLFFGFFFLYKWRTTQLKKQKSVLEQRVKERTQTIEEQAEKLRRTEKLKSRFFANVSHELRTPLTLMLGPTGSLLKRGYLNEKDLKLLQYIYNNEKHLLNLVNEILDLSKLETNRIPIKKTEVNFYDYLQPLVAQFKSYGDSAFVTFDIDYQLEKALNLSLDTDKFEKIVNNFLSNALKFTPAKGSVILTVKESDDKILISVKDTGSGIHPDDLPHVFERFYQSKQPNAPVQGGTGIGLSLCKELAELLDGKVWAESEFGVGSVFYFEFPKKETVDGGRLSVDGFRHSPPASKGQHLPAATTAETFEPTAAGGSSPFRGLGGASSNSPSTVDRLPSTILIVEDNPELRDYLKTILEDRYQILQAENGQIALNLLSQNKVDLIISDLMMPVMDGFQLLEHVKSKDRWRHLPVIMLTARKDVKVKLRALRIGVDDYITKPFEEEVLLAGIENLLRNYQIRQSLNKSETKTNGTPNISKEDTFYLQNLEDLVNEHISDYHLNADFLASKLAVSRSVFFKKVKQLTGLSVNDYINEVRYTKARELMENRSVVSVKVAAGKVGMKDVKYFSKQFKNRFGKSPSAYF